MTADVVLTAQQWKLLERHACTLQHHERTVFRHAVLSRLSGAPSVPALEAAISVVLERRPLFVCAADSKGVEP
jgi:hypothetical protein